MRVEKAPLPSVPGALRRLAGAAARASLVGVAALALVATAGCATKSTAGGGAARPPSERAEDFYPLDPGWKWAYDVERGAERILATYAVIERREETAVVQAGTERLLYAVMSDGVARRDGTMVGDYLLKSPIRVGTQWMVTGGQAQITAVGKSVTIDAGTFANCAVVEENRTNPDRVIRTTFAPGVGPLLIEAQEHDPASGRYDVVLKATLRGFTRPGEDPLGGGAATGR